MISTSLAPRLGMSDLQAQIVYPQPGMCHAVLLAEGPIHCSLMCLAPNTQIAEHDSCLSATLTVLEGQGSLIVEGQEILLQPGMRVFLPAHTPHALHTSVQPLAFLLRQWLILDV